MAFEKRTWLARIGTGLNKFIIGAKDANNKQTLENSPDSVTQQGDVISADNLNDLEDRIDSAFKEKEWVKIWENPNSYASFASNASDPIVVDGLIHDFIVEYRKTSTTYGTMFKRFGFAPSSLAIGSTIRVGNLSYTEITDLTSSKMFYDYEREVGFKHDNDETSITFYNCLLYAWIDNNNYVQTDNSNNIPVAVYKLGNN